MDFSEKVQRLRREAGLSQEELADRLEVTRQSVSKWETGGGYPETEKIVRLGRLFGVSLDYLLGEDQPDRAQRGERGLYVSREMAEGYLHSEKSRSLKIALGVGLLVGGNATLFLFEQWWELGYLALVIAAVALFVSAALEARPYARLKRERLDLDPSLARELRERCGEIQRRCRLAVVAGVVLLGTSMLLLPTLLGYTDPIMGLGSLGSGLGLYLIVFYTQINASCRPLGGGE